MATPFKRAYSFYKFRWQTHYLRPCSFLFFLTHSWTHFSTTSAFVQSAVPTQVDMLWTPDKQQTRSNITFLTCHLNIWSSLTLRTCQVHMKLLQPIPLRFHFNLNYYMLANFHLLLVPKLIIYCIILMVVIQHYTVPL